MSQMMITMAFSLYLIGYGFIALFKKEWIQKLRSASSQTEGREKLKNDDSLRKNWLAILSLVFGFISLLMNIAMIVLMNRAAEL